MANEKILVVDDDTNICELLRLYLTKEGYQVTTANDGEEGLEKFNQLKPDMGADDYMVKPFDTKEVVARIKAVLRRCTAATTQTESTEGVIEFDNLRLDMNSYELRVKGKVVEAPPKELELSTPATSFWTRCGASSTTATAAPSTSMSSACARSWPGPPTSGS